MSLRQLCRETIAQFQKLDLSQASHITATDINELDRLLALLNRIKEALQRVRVIQSDEPPEPG
jgi:hypothetical protein